MFVQFGKTCVVVTLVVMLGAHWAVLQTVAWTAMLADNLQSCAFRDAVVKTFDGKHPCCLCKAIAAGKQSEKKNEFSLQLPKLEFPPVKGNFVLTPPTRIQVLPAHDFFGRSFMPEPPTPPPRGLFT